tara:strand:+ start:218 stop:520 length:303 start_codon:yes stop_codon:yes gene_type:complete
MAGNPQVGYTGITPNKTDFELKGIPGSYKKVVSVTSTTLDFTGSNYGASAIMLAATTNGTASMAGGGIIDLSDLSANIEYPFSVSQVTEDSGNVVYVLIK